MKIYIWILFSLLIASCGKNDEILKAKEKNELLFRAIENGTADSLFPLDYFPKDATTVLMKQLRDYCNFKNRTETFLGGRTQVDMMNKKSQIALSYKLILKCDSMILTTTYINSPSNDSLMLFEFKLDALR